MTKLLENVPEKDPVAIPEKRELIDQIIEKNRHLKGATMVILNELQNRIGFITPAMQAYTARKLDVPMGAIHGVVTFYSFFSTVPRGKNLIRVCLGTACYVRG